MEENYKFIAENYGKTYSDIVKKYCNNNSNETKDISTISLFLKDDYKKIGQEYIKDIFTLKNMHAYLDGLKDGVKNYNILSNDKKDEYICDYVLSKDFTIIMDFHDNDFDAIIETSILNYAKKYNKLISMINLYSKLGNAQSLMNYYIKNVERMEDIEFVAKYISSAYYANNILHELEDSSEFNGKSGIELKLIKEKSEDNAFKYLGLDKSENYIKGTYNEIEKYVLNKYKDQQSEKFNEGKDLSSCWLNGEVLFISMRNGRMLAWVQ